MCGVLPDVQGLRGRTLAGVAGGGEGGFGAGDEGREVRGGAVAVEDGFVADDDQVNDVPLRPVGDGGDLFLGLGETAGVDEYTGDHLQAGDFAGVTDVLESGAIGAVDADGFESSGFDGGHVDHDLGFAQAGPAGSVWGVDHTPLLAAASNAASRAGWRGRRALWCGASCDSGALGGLGGRCGCYVDGCAGRSNVNRGGGWSRGGRSEWAVDDIVCLGNSGHNLGLSVGAWGVRNRGWVNADGIGGDGCGDGSNRVGTGRGADIGGCQDGAGDNAGLSGNGGVWANNGRGGRDNGRDSSNGVGSSGYGGGTWSADGGGGAQSQGRGWDGVDAGCWAGGSKRRWDRQDDGACCACNDGA